MSFLVLNIIVYPLHPNHPPQPPSTASHVEFLLDQYHTKEELKTAVDALEYTGGGTSTHEALEQMRTVLFNVTNGARPLNDGHPRVRTGGGVGVGGAT